MTDKTFQIGDRVEEDGNYATVVEVGTYDVCVIFDYPHQTHHVSVRSAIAETAPKLGLTATVDNWNGWHKDVAADHYKRLKPIKRDILQKGDRILVSVSYDGKRDVVPATVLISAEDWLSEYEDDTDYNCPVVQFDNPHACAGPTDPAGDTSYTWSKKDLKTPKAAAKELGITFNGAGLTALPKLSASWGGVCYSYEVLSIIAPSIQEGDWVEIVGVDTGVALDATTLALRYKTKGAVLLTAAQKKQALSLGAIKPKWALKLTNQMTRKTSKPIDTDDLQIGDEVDFLDDSEEMSDEAPQRYTGTVVSTKKGSAPVAWVKKDKSYAATDADGFDHPVLIEYNAKKLGLKGGAFTGVSEVKSIIKKAATAKKIAFSELAPGDKITAYDDDLVVSGTVLYKEGKFFVLAADKDFDAYDRSDAYFYRDIEVDYGEISDKSKQARKIDKVAKKYGVKTNDLSLIDIDKSWQILDRTPVDGDQADDDEETSEEEVEFDFSTAKVGDRLAYRSSGKVFNGTVVNTSDRGVHLAIDVNYDKANIQYADPVAFAMDDEPGEDYDDETDKAILRGLDDYGIPVDEVLITTLNFEENATDVIGFLASAKKVAKSPKETLKAKVIEKIAENKAIKKQVTDLNDLIVAGKLARDQVDTLIDFGVAPAIINSWHELYDKDKEPAIADCKLGDRVELSIFRTVKGKTKSKTVSGTYLCDDLVWLDREIVNGASSSYAFDELDPETELAAAAKELGLDLCDEERLWLVEASDTEIITITKRANAPKQKDRTMTESKAQGLWDTFKVDGTEAAYRITAKQMTTGVRAAILAGIKAKGGDGAKMEIFKGLLESEYGEGIIEILLGNLGPMIPTIGADPRMAKLFGEFRVGGITTVGNAVLGEAMEFVVPAIQDAMKSLPPLTEGAATGVRVKPPVLVTNNEQEAEEAKTQAVGRR